MRRAWHGLRHVGHTTCLHIAATHTSTITIKPASATWQTGVLRGVSASASSRSRQADPRGISLRPYQEECIQAVLQQLSSGERRLGVALATGSGKTVIFSHLIDRVKPPHPHATQTLIIAHRRELIYQAANHCRSLYPDKVIEIEMGQEQASGLADITIASVQSMMSADRLMRYDPTKFKLLLVDEAHHIVAPQYLEVLGHFQLLETQKRGHTSLLGVTATFSRHDGRRLGTAIDQIAYNIDYMEMIKLGYLSDVTFTTVQSGVDLRKVRVSTDDDFAAKALSKAVNNDQANIITVKAWLVKAGSRRSTLIFCVDVQHVLDLTAEFRRHGIDAKFVTGSTPPKVRTERLESFKAGNFAVLLNCGIFTEGTDIPSIDCIVLARPTKSRNLLVQMLGRGLRMHPGKKDCYVIDMVASLETGIMTVPTLYGLDPGEMVQEADHVQMESLRERREKEKQREQAALPPKPGGDPTPTPALTGNITFTDYENVNDLVGDTNSDKHIRTISPFSWVQVDTDRYVLSNRDGQLLRIQRRTDSGSEFIVTVTRKLPQGSPVPFARPKEVGKFASFEHAVRGADTFASETFPFDFIAQHAYWRKAVASRKQIDFLNTFRKAGEKLEYESLRSGAAADQITKIRHGARGRFKSIAASKKRAQREAAEKETKRKQQHIAPGPVTW